jgi:hypothetical protein
LHIPLDRWRLAAALAGVDLLLWWLARHAASRQSSLNRTMPSAREWFPLWPWGPPVLLACCAENALRLPIAPPEPNLPP